MAQHGSPLIRPKQIKLDEWPNPRDHQNYVQLVKALSAAGFNWDPDDHGWHRKRDAAAFADEPLEDIARLYPVLVPALVKAIQHGAGTFHVTVGEQDDGSWAIRLVPEFNPVDALAGLA